MRQRKLLTIVVSAIATVGFFAGCSRNQTSSTDATPQDLVPLLAQPYDAAESTPESFDLTDMDAQSVRLIGDSHLGRHWVALDEEGNMCILTELAEVELGSIACTTAEIFQDRGVAHRLNGTDITPVEVHVFPADIMEENIKQAMPADVELGAENGPQLIGRDGTTALVFNSDIANKLQGLKIQRDAGAGTLTLFTF